MTHHHLPKCKGLGWRYKDSLAAALHEMLRLEKEGYYVATPMPLGAKYKIMYHQRGCPACAAILRRRDA